MTHQGSPLLVVAGAGTGKTRVIVSRLAWLIEQGLEPDRTLAVTFTNRAASELKERVAAIVGSRGESINVGTFHWLGNRILRRYGRELRVGPNFHLASPSQSLSIVREMLALIPREERPSPVEVRRLVSSVRNAGKTADSSWAAEMAELYGRHMRDRGWLDLDDLILESVWLLSHNAQVRKRLSRHFQHVLVDEYQDTNPPQVKLLRALVDESGGISAVGDDDQAIYAWRYASSDNMSTFSEVFPGGEIVRLEENYRSTQRILTPANVLLQHNRRRLGKTLRALRQAGSKPVIFAGGDEAEEALFVAHEIARLQPKGIDFSEIAVVYRVNSQSRAIEDSLVRAGIPYHVRAGHRFYERPEVLRLVDALSVTSDSTDPARWQRLLQHFPGFGPVRATSVAELVWRHQTESTADIAVPRMARELLTRLTETVAATSLNADLMKSIDTWNDLFKLSAGYPSSIGSDDDSMEANVAEFRSIAQQFARENYDHSPIQSFLDRLQLVSHDTDGGPVKSVQLMTIHAAKGTEFGAVFVVGLEEGLLPHKRSLTSVEALEEERRLLYVAMTRAKDVLYLSYARTRLRSDGVTAAGPSRFLENMPPNLFTLARFEGARQRDRLPNARTGDRVRHPRWGDGAVTGASGLGPNRMVTIAFDSGDVKTVQLRHAPLKRIS